MRRYMAAFDRLIMPVAQCFDPDLVLVSAGFDAARGDPLGGCDVTPTGYAHMTARLLTLARGRVVVALEGGYNLRSIALSAEAVLRVLMGAPPPPLFDVPSRIHARPSAAVRGLGGLSAREAEVYDEVMRASKAAAEHAASDGASSTDEFEGISKADVLKMLSPANVAEAAIQETARYLAPYWPCLRALASARQGYFDHFAVAGAGGSDGADGEQDDEDEDEDAEPRDSVLGRIVANGRTEQHHRDEGDGDDETGTGSDADAGGKHAVKRPRTSSH